jgi:hypothetical protein
MDQTRDDGVLAEAALPASVRSAVGEGKPAHVSPFPQLAAHFRSRPIAATFGFFVEYATFAAGVGLALALFATRVPLRFFDRVTGWSVRERFVDLLARISPG